MPKVDRLFENLVKDEFEEYHVARQQKEHFRAVVVVYQDEEPKDLCVLVTVDYRQRHWKNQRLKFFPPVSATLKPNAFATKLHLMRKHQPMFTLPQGGFVGAANVAVAAMNPALVGMLQQQQVAGTAVSTPS